MDKYEEWNNADACLDATIKCLGEGRVPNISLLFVVSDYHKKHEPRKWWEIWK